MVFVGSRSVITLGCAQSFGTSSGFFASYGYWHLSTQSSGLNAFCGFPLAHPGDRGDLWRDFLLGGVVDIVSWAIFRNLGLVWLSIEETTINKLEADKYIEADALGLLQNRLPQSMFYRTWRKTYSGNVLYLPF